MATITANRSTDLRTIDLYDMVSSASSIQFFDNANFTSAQGYVYPDVVRIAYMDLLPTYALWGGTNVTVNNEGAVTGGTVTGFISQVFSGGSYVQAYAVEGFAYSAVGVYNASISPSTSDDQAAFETVLAGADTFNLSAESDAANGFAGNDTLRGNGGGDLLYGGSGNDLLDGGSGADLLYGGAGNDSYVVDSTGDSVTEFAGEGVDTVRSSVGRTLGSNQENLVLTGSTAINGTGNTLANQITGNVGANVLNGGGGADSLIGGTGNDTYVIGNTGVVVTELAGGGVDTVRSSVSRTLGANQENLVLTGSASINGTGNTQANQITGNAGANVLNGGGGADLLVGGAGDDTYVIGNSGVTVTELAGGGIDTIRSSVSCGLGSQGEILVLTGTAAIVGSGNTLANLMTGNAGANLLSGGGGNDTLNGGAGSDTLSGVTGNDTLNGGAGRDSLIGGSGLDSFRFTTTLDATTNVDRVVNFVSADDRFLLDDAVFAGIGPTGTLAAAAFRIGGAAADASDRIIYNPTSGALYFDADGSGAGAAIRFATLDAGTTLSVSDFVIV
ncbi:MAG: calcium-binding protein [Piscinibacter sp.]|uniref:calcium-binding protein n=1 Tax=Piscinibacter sp. TaxID=1903157 RepID=UPI002585E19F|nr:calcium-binding protein [Piscinibacter sp.]MCW5664514.1 calcium-binding protein [Piscinibacter sp.]